MGSREAFIAGSTAITAFLFGAAVTPAAAAALTVVELVDFCQSSSFADAVEKGSRLGWRRLEDKDFEDWRTSFASHLGGTVEVAGWRRDDMGSDSLSFWVAEGLNAHRACAYTTKSAGTLLEELSKQFGAPRTSDKTGLSITAYWSIGKTQVAFSQMASSAYVNIGFYK